MLIAALAIGSALSLGLLHLTGLSAGGIVTPGYLALVLDKPRDLAIIVLAAIAAWTIVRLIGDWLMLYGARRFGVTVLIGLCLSLAGNLAAQRSLVLAGDWTGLGYIVPGLLAHQLDRQGFFTTMLLVAIAAPLVRVILLAITWWFSW
jgi:poly-gamma-glutamate biosynthesis protein PgsC/CapC